MIAGKNGGAWVINGGHCLALPSSHENGDVFQIGERTGGLGQNGVARDRFIAGCVIDTGKDFAQGTNFSEGGNWFLFGGHEINFAVKRWKQKNGSVLRYIG